MFSQRGQHRVISAKTRAAVRGPAVLALLGAAMVVLLIMSLLANGCARVKDETIAGVLIPVPAGMIRDAENASEMSLLGFGAGQASFHGTMGSEEVVEFYRNEMAARGWQPNMNLRSGGAMLAYSKEGKTLLIGIGQQQGETQLTLTVGGLTR
ncbi:MAG TPA: hypothetical protein VFV82_12400 [Candidatus Binatia bacterium]|nr:hypothetical protein [Candidatus Binatia bacterium]